MALPVEVSVVVGRALFAHQTLIALLAAVPGQARRGVVNLATLDEQVILDIQPLVADIGRQVGTTLASHNSLVARRAILHMYSTSCGLLVDWLEKIVAWS